MTRTVKYDYNNKRDGKHDYWSHITEHFLITKENTEFRYKKQTSLNNRTLVQMSLLRAS